MRQFALLFLFVIQLTPIFAQKTAAEWLKDGKELFDRDRVAARHACEQASDRAVQEGDRQLEARALFCIGSAFSRDAQYEMSNVQLRAALALFEQLGDRRKAAEVYTYLGSNATDLGKQTESRGHYEKAMALFEALEDWPAVAQMHHALAFYGGEPEAQQHIQRGLELARQVGARKTEAQLLHTWADHQYATDDFDAAFDRLSQARSILESLGDRIALAGVLTSIGRLYRVHGHPDQAFLYYQRSRDLQKEAGDVPGEIQSLQAMGVALNYLGRSPEALRFDQEALQFARQSGSPLLIKFILEAVASSQMHLGNKQQAAVVLEEARQMQPPRMETLLQLADVRYQLGQYDAALKAADEALSSGYIWGELTRHALANRAQALRKLGRAQDALRDVRQLTQSVEEARARLVPTDFMKQGFSNTDHEATSLSIKVLLDNGEEREALETAERARSRAFLDLLATKSITHHGPNQGDGALPPLPLRGPVSSGERPVLSNHASAAHASAGNAVVLARRLNSTILAYWVDDRSTVIWTVSPRGRISHVRSEIGARTLEKWVDDALSAGDPVTPSRVQIASRSGEAVLAGRQARDSWRELYNALIRPVRSSLPLKPGSRLTIIPSGPLFRLSFAALVDEKGRYLIENYALNYAPAMEAFQYTRQAQQRTAALPVRYLLVANPSGMPSSDGKPLPPLPGSEKEVQSIFRLTPPGSTVLLQGKRADEAGVRAAMPGATVIHLATHGIIDDRDPLASFLAFGRTNAQPGANGRLTAEEVYSIDLRADLVVLSACRTGLGRISGDGVAGLARAFFYAGTASVVSTLWDVADQPTAPLIEDFYRAFAKGGRNGKIEALRDAQLRLLRSLRKGELRVDTPFGTLALPEDPVLWAGFVLMGEP